MQCLPKKNIRQRTETVQATDMLKSNKGIESVLAPNPWRNASKNLISLYKIIMSQL
jgi:hypothetical protein